MFSGQKEMEADTQRTKNGADQDHFLALKFQPFLCARPCQNMDLHFDRQQINHSPRPHLIPVEEEGSSASHDRLLESKKVV